MQITGVSSTYGGVDTSQFMSRMKRTPPSAGEMAEFLVKMKDSDGDGVLSAGETDFDEDVFSTIDTDGNGALSLEELTTDAENRRADMERQGFSPGMPPSGLMGMAPMAASDMATSFLENSDEDADGALSISETRFSDDEFSGIDGDGNGLLSLEELEADAEKRIAQGPPPPPPGAESASNDSSFQAFLSALSEGYAASNDSGASNLSSLLDTRA